MLRLDVNEEVPVVRLVVWQIAQPMEMKRLRPLVIEVAPPGTVVEGVGGAKRRMNIANCARSLSVPIAVVLKLVWSSGVALPRQFAGRPLVAE